MRQPLQICMLGGTGFVGRHIAARLVANGHSVKILTRQREQHRELLVLPNLQLIEADIFDRAQLHKHFSRCDAVINLVGILNEKGHRGTGFHHAHVELAKLIVDACLNTHVRRLLHMSALNADAVSGSSFYLRSKGEAENLLMTYHGELLAITCFRPSVIFGAQDSFFNRFASLLKLAPVLPLACPQARFAPVYVGDVANRFISALDAAATYGQRYNLCGPHDYSLLDLVRYTRQLLGLKRCIIALPDSLSKLQAGIFEWLPGKPFSLDNYRSLQVDSVCAAAEREPISIEAVVPGYIGSRNTHCNFDQIRKTARR